MSKTLFRSDSPDHWERDTPQRPVKEYWTRDLETPAPRADSLKDDPRYREALKQERAAAMPESKPATLIDAGEEVTRARRDAALSDIRAMHKTSRRGYYGKG